MAELLTVKQIADRLGVSPQTIRNVVQNYPDKIPEPADYKMLAWTEEQAEEFMHGLRFLRPDSGLVSAKSIMSELKVDARYFHSVRNRVTYFPLPVETPLSRFMFFTEEDAVHIREIITSRLLKRKGKKKAREDAAKEFLKVGVGLYPSSKLPTPTDAPPGSAERVQEYRRRLECGEALYHPLDVTAWQEGACHRMTSMSILGRSDNALLVDSEDDPDDWDSLGDI